VSYTNWMNLEPNNAGGNEHCAYFHQDGTWNDNLCSILSYALCEFPSVTPPPLTDEPSATPTDAPTSEPTYDPTVSPTYDPTGLPTSQPTEAPTVYPQNLLSNCTNICEDQFSWCKSTLSQEDCLTANPHTREYIRAVCPVSCDVCEEIIEATSEPAPTTECVDFLPVCEELSFNCDHVEFNVLCPFTCGLCSTDYPTSMPTSAPTGLCVDNLHELEDTVNQLENVVKYLMDYIFC